MKLRFSKLQIIFLCIFLESVKLFKFRPIFWRKVKSLNILFPLRTLKVKKIWIFKNLFFPKLNTLKKSLGSMTISSLVLLLAEIKGWVMGTCEFCLRTLLRLIHQANATLRWVLKNHSLVSVTHYSLSFLPLIKKDQ